MGSERTSSQSIQIAQENRTTGEAKPCGASAVHTPPPRLLKTREGPGDLRSAKQVSKANGGPRGAGFTKRGEAQRGVQGTGNLVPDMTIEAAFKFICIYY